jgi:hypothetical protein
MMFAIVAVFAAQKIPPFCNQPVERLAGVQGGAIQHFQSDFSRALMLAPLRWC